MKNILRNPSKSWLKYLAALALVIAMPTFGADTMHDALSLHNHGVNDAVLIAWASQQPPIDLTRQNLTLLTDAGISKDVLRALILGNTAKPRIAARAQADDTRIAAAPQVIAQSETASNTVVVNSAPNSGTVILTDGYYDNYDYYGYPYGYPWGSVGFGSWSNHNYNGHGWWNLGSGHNWNQGHNWNNGHNWNHNWSQNGNGASNGFVSGSSVHGAIGATHRTDSAASMTGTRSGAWQNNAHQSAAPAPHYNYSAPATHGYSGGGYSGGRSFSGGGGHTFGGGGHSFGGGGGHHR